MGRIVKSIFSPKAPPMAPPPQIEEAPVEELEKEKTRNQRRRLFKTEGGQAGQELLAGGVSQRNTLLGN